MQNHTNRFSWFDVTDDVKELLILAAQNWENTEESTKYGSSVPVMPNMSLFTPQPI
jgi:hypothetical protein